MDTCQNVTLETASPAGTGKRGAGMTIRAGIASSPFGNCLIGETTQGICHLAFWDQSSPDHAIHEIQADWPLATVVRDDTHAAQLAAGIFSNDPSAHWKVLVFGTPFQIRIWQTLTRIPRGTVTTYGQLAAMAGMPKAARAAGSALSNNRIAFLIPCHRIIRGSGVTGHYRWGANRKQSMLDWERTHA